ncbi:MAG TPA: NAD(P)-dependent alcohol dehydrogenase [Steroidobacteraceae bacterium]|jgi:aryl-alcohol dehydrogenase|nr:NAD(P)-dependent alcohol dehydrogenase [Steroidobacteraceae bacterium]
MKTLAAISREGASHPVLEEIELEGPRAGEVLVRIVASGICHTDARAGASGGPGTPRPVVLGHEGAGIVEEVGAGVTSLQVGDHVVLSGSSCGQCTSCRHNLPSYCVQMYPRNFGGSRIDGSSAYSQNGQRLHGHFFGQSSFAKHTVVAERTAVKVPREVPLEILGPLGCGVITGTGAVINSLNVGAGDTLAVFGTGSVGLSAIMAARLVGAARIIAVDVVPKRLVLAAELGATDVINAKETPALAQAIRDLVPGGVTYSFNTTSVPAIYSQALECLGMRGTAAFVTAPRGDWQPQMFAMLANGRRLQGLLGGDAAPQLFIPMLIEYYEQGRMPFDRLIRFYRFEQIAEAFRDMEHGETIKPVLRMQD